MKKMIAIVLCLMLALSMAGAANAEATAELTAAMFETPILMTSVGQSADVNIVNTLFTKAGVSDVRMNPTVTADDLGDAKTLVLAIGGSSKGLGAAGIDENQEMERVTALISAAKEAGVKVLSLHIGGQARRGALSDLFIPDAIAASDAAIVKADGDTDNMMRDILLANTTPALFVAGQIDVVDPIKLVFGVE